MTNQVKQALHKSIDFWFDNLMSAQLSKESGVNFYECGYNNSCHDTYLCDVIWNKDKDPQGIAYCYECPVYLKTGKIECGCTELPHIMVVVQRTTKLIATQHLIDSIGRYINFLISLLPDNN